MSKENAGVLVQKQTGSEPIEHCCRYDLKRRNV